MDKGTLWFHMHPVHATAEEVVNIADVWHEMDVDVGGSRSRELHTMVVVPEPGRVR